MILCCVLGLDGECEFVIVLLVLFGSGDMLVEVVVNLVIVLFVDCVCVVWVDF